MSEPTYTSAFAEIRQQHEQFSAAIARDLAPLNEQLGFARDLARALAPLNKQLAAGIARDLAPLTKIFAPSMRSLSKSLAATSAFAEVQRQQTEALSRIARNAMPAATFTKVFDRMAQDWRASGHPGGGSFTLVEPPDDALVEGPWPQDEAQPSTASAVLGYRLSPVHWLIVLVWFTHLALLAKAADLRTFDEEAFDWMSDLLAVAAVLTPVAMFLTHQPLKHERRKG